MYFTTLIVSIVLAMPWSERPDQPPDDFAGLVVYLGADGRSVSITLPMNKDETDTKFWNSYVLISNEDILNKQIPFKTLDKLPKIFGSDLISGQWRDISLESYLFRFRFNPQPIEHWAAIIQTGDHQTEMNIRLSNLFSQNKGTQAFIELTDPIKHWRDYVVKIAQLKEENPQFKSKFVSNAVYNAKMFEFDKSMDWARPHMTGLQLWYSLFSTSVKYLSKQRFNHINHNCQHLTTMLLESLSQCEVPETSHYMKSPRLKPQTRVALPVLVGAHSLWKALGGAPRDPFYHKPLSVKQSVPEHSLEDVSDTEYFETESDSGAESAMGSLEAFGTESMDGDSDTD